MYVSIFVCVCAYVFTKNGLKTPKGLKGPLSPLQELEGKACCAQSLSFINYEIPAKKFMPKFNLFSVIRDKYSSSLRWPQA